MASGRSILVRILGDASGFSKEIASATKSSASFGNILQGIGQGIGQAAFGLVTNAVHDVVGALGDSVKAAEVNEVAYTKLSASLKANVAGWDGNLESIKAVNEAGANLGFTDTEMADSLARLLPATHDVAQAEHVRAVAMDLSRLKGISLAEAGDALTKVEAGSYRILKSLGIELPKNATQTEALAAVQKVAAGQAEAYGNTTEGAFAKMNAKIDEAQVKIGQGLMPLLTKAATAAGDFFSAIDGSTRDYVTSLESLTQHYIEQGSSLDDLRQHLKDVQDAQASGIAWSQSEQDSLARSAYWTEVLISDQEKWQTSLDSVTGGVNSTEVAIRNETAAMYEAGRAAAQYTSPIIDYAKAIGTIGKEASPSTVAAHDLALAIYGPKASLDGAVTSAKDNLAKLNLEMDKLIEKKKPTAADKSSITQLKGQIQDANAALLIAEASKVKLTGGTVPAALNKYLLTGEQHLGKMSDEAYAAWKYLYQLSGLGNYTYTVEFKSATGHHAAGGFAPYGQAAMFGEQGPELGIPGVGGYNILTAQQTAGLMGGGGTTVVVNINGGLVDGPTIDALTNAIARRMRFATGI